MKKIFKNDVAGLIAGGFICYVLYQILATGMYTYHLNKFLERDYSFKEHGFALNGKSLSGDTINVRDLLAYTPEPIGSSVQEMCRDVQSERGHTTLGFVGEYAVCCWTADEDQWLVPYKEVGDTRHYLCGAWPHLDHVTQKIADSKLGIK